MNLEQLNAITDKLKAANKLQREAYNMAVEYEANNKSNVRLCENVLGVSDTVSIHVYKGLEALAKDLIGPDICLAIHPNAYNSIYHIEKSFIHQGVRYFQLYRTEENL